MDGADLRRFLSYRGGKLVPAEAAGIAAQVAAALAAAHQDGGPHGDLRPENIVVAQRSTPPAVQVTGFGGAGATGAYTAPEVAAGGSPTAAADIWALGVLLIEMITGDARGAAATLPAPLNVVARDCLATDPGRRPSAQRVAAYLFQVAATPGGIGEFVAETPAPDSPAATAGGLSAAASAFAAAADAMPTTSQGTFPERPAGNAGAWAGWAPPPGPHPEQAEPTTRTGRWRKGPLVTLGTAALVAAVLTGLTMTASAGERAVPAAQQAGPTPQATSTAPEPPAAAPSTTRLAAPPPSTTAARERLRVTLAGQVANDGGTLALSIRDGAAIAYVCDGDRIESWLKGTAKAGVLALKGRDGSTLTGTFDARGAEGEVTVAGKTNRFELGVVRKPSGLYRTAARVRGAQIDGGWIVLADGRQVGVLTRDGRPAPAPMLDVATRTTTVDGERVPATTVDADSGEGF